MTNRHDWQTSKSTYYSVLSDEYLKELVREGINYIELVLDCEWDFYIKNAQNIYDMAKRYGVNIRTLHLPFWTFDLLEPASTDRARRDSFIEIQKPIVEAAAKSGIGIMVVHPSAEPYDDATRSENLKYSIETMSGLCEITDRLGVKLAIENLPRTCIGRDCAEIKAIYDAVPNSYFCFDANHSLTDDNVDIIKAMGERIINLHISDYDFVDEKHWFPGEGKNDWQAIIAQLEEQNYTGTWNYEIRDEWKYRPCVFKRNHEELMK